MNTRDDLLQASLGHEDSLSTALYSSRTGYVTSFFGGPLAGAVIAMANAYRLRRLRTDWPLGVAGVALHVGFLWWWARGGGAQWSRAHLEAGSASVFTRILGLVFFAAAYAWHRQYYRNMAFMNLESPSGWVIGIAAILGGVGLDIGLTAAWS